MQNYVPKYEFIHNPQCSDAFTEQPALPLSNLSPCQEIFFQISLKGGALGQIRKRDVRALVDPGEEGVRLRKHIGHLVFILEGADPGSLWQTFPQRRAKKPGGAKEGSALVCGEKAGDKVPRHIVGAVAGLRGEIRVRWDVDVDCFPFSVLCQFKFQRAQAEEPGGQLSHGPEVPVKAEGAVAFLVFIYKAGKAFQSFNIYIAGNAKGLIGAPGFPAADEHKGENFYAKRVLADQRFQPPQGVVPGGGGEKLLKKGKGLGEEVCKLL